MLNQPRQTTCTVIISMHKQKVKKLSATVALYKLKHSIGWHPVSPSPQSSYGWGLAERRYNSNWAYNWTGPMSCTHICPTQNPIFDIFSIKATDPYSCIILGYGTEVPQNLWAFWKQCFTNYEAFFAQILLRPSCHQYWP